MTTLCACDLHNVVRMDPHKVSACVVRAAMDAYADRLIADGEPVSHSRRIWMQVQAETSVRAGASRAAAIAQAKLDDRAAYPRAAK